MVELKNGHIRKNLTQKCDPRDLAGNAEEEEEEEPNIRFPSLTTEQMRSNEYEVHQATKSQQHTKFYTNYFTTLWNIWHLGFCFLTTVFLLYHPFHLYFFFQNPLQPVPLPEVGMHLYGSQMILCKIFNHAMTGKTPVGERKTFRRRTRREKKSCF